MKILDLFGLTELIDLCKSNFASITHKHKISDIEDFQVDSSFSATSTNPIQNKTVNNALLTFAGDLDKIEDKLNTIEEGATKTAKSNTNGNILINGTETVVYTHPTGTNPHGTTRADVGLGNVDNTSDANKPVSTAQAAAIKVVHDDVNTLEDKFDAHAGNADIHFTADERTKLAGIASDANKYTHPNSDVTAGTYKSVTVDAQGHVTGGSNPTTLSGFGITDAYTITEVNEAISNANEYTDKKVANLLNNSSEAVDSIMELADAMKNNADAIEALEGIASSKVPTSRKINGKALTSDITLSAGDVGADVSGSANAVQTNLNTHASNETHITSDERTNWNTHASSAHAPASAQANVIESIKVNGTAQTITSKAVNITVPTKASDIGAATDDHTHTVDSSLSTTSTNPVQNKVVQAAIKAVDDKTTALSTNKANASDLTSHTGNTTVHITKNERDSWNSKLDSVSLASGTNNGTVKLTVDGVATDNIAVKGLGSAAYTSSSNYAASSHTSTTANGSTLGHVKLSDSVELTSGVNDGIAATPTAVKNAYDLANSKADKTHTHTVANISDLSVTATELNYMSGVTSNVKAKLDSLQNEIDTHEANSNIHFTSSERTKLSGIQAGAEVNQNAFSNIKVGTTTVAADNKTDTVEFVGSNVTITPDATNDKITFSVADGNTGAKGLVKLDNTVSTSETTAATPKAVKSAYDLANTAKTNAATAQAAADSAAANSIVGLSVSGQTVTYTKGDGTTDTITTQDTKYTHPSYTARTGKPTANQTPGFGGTVTISQPVSDASGHITALTDRTITIPNAAATTATAGLMSAADKVKLNGIATGANKYSLPTASTATIGGVKSGSTVTSTSGLTACPIISGVPYYKNTTYSGAGSSLGLVKSGGDVTISSGVITVNDDSHSHSNYLPLTGGILTDNLYVQTASYPSFRATDSTVGGCAMMSDYGSAAVFESRNANNETTNRRRLFLRNTTADVDTLDKALYINSTDNGTASANYYIYGEHNKPTPADIGAAAASHNHTIANVDGLQTALNGKLATTGTAAKATSATSATYATTATSAGSASKATSATSATYAATATKSGSATNATNADTATYAKNAGTAAYSSNGAKATSATSATYASTATKAGTATYATNSGTATYATRANKATTASKAGTASGIAGGSKIGGATLWHNNGYGRLYCSTAAVQIESWASNASTSTTGVTRSMLAVYHGSDLSKAARLVKYTNGSGKSYNLYGTHNVTSGTASAPSTMQDNDIYIKY